MTRKGKGAKGGKKGKKGKGSKGGWKGAALGFLPGAGASSVATRSGETSVSAFRGAASLARAVGNLARAYHLDLFFIAVGIRGVCSPLRTKVLYLVF